jgi:RHS repeat-associated protein
VSVQTTYIRDGYGNIVQTQQNWVDPINGPGAKRSTSVQYDTGYGRFPVTTTNAIGQSEQHGYDAGTGAKTSLTDINLLTTTWTVDGFGRVTSENRPDGTTTKYYRKQCAGQCPATAFDNGVGDVPMIPDVVTIQDHVLTNSLTTRIAVPELDFVDFAGHHLRKQSYGFDGTEIDTDAAYDAYGRQLVSFQPTYAGNTPLMAQVLQLDELNRVTQVTTSDDGGNLANTTTAYNGLSATVTNPKQQTKTTINNVLGQLVQTIDAANNSTYFGRDAYGNLLQTTDPYGNQVNITYDNLGRKISMQDPDLGLITYWIDPLGREYQEVNPNEKANNVVTTFAHDMLDRMTQRIEPSLPLPGGGTAPGLTSIWVYDNVPSTTTAPSAPMCAVNVPAISIPSSAPACAATASCGKLVEAYTQIGTGKDYDRVQTYDSIGRPSATAIAAYKGSYSSGTCYDGYDRVSSIVDQWTPASGNALTKTFAQYYNNYGYMQQVARVTGTGSNTVAQVLWQANAQDAEDRVLQAALGNGLAVKRDYYPYSERLQDTYLTNPSVSGTMLLQEGYQYDVLGNVAIRTEYWSAGQSGFSESFKYDAMNRLYTSQVTSNSKTSLQTFTYDNVGDIVSKTGVGTGNYSYPQPGQNVMRPHAVQSIAGLAGTFQYDANGNMTGDPYGRSTTWNSFDMPVLMSMGSSSSQFVYGPEHQRTLQTRHDGSMIVYAGSMEIVMQNGNSTIKTYWPAGLGVEIDAPGAATTLNWTHTDNLGSVVAVTGSNGNLEESTAYDPWGARRDQAGDAAQLANYKEIVDNKGFTDQEMLDQLNLVHLNGRVYDPLVGRFLSADPEIQDPTHSQSYNRYAYVWNNPTNLTDPTGFQAQNANSTSNTSYLCLKCADGQDVFINPDGSFLVGSWDGDSKGTNGTFTGVAGASNGTAKQTNITQSGAQGAAQSSAPGTAGQSASSQTREYGDKLAAVSEAKIEHKGFLGFMSWLGEDEARADNARYAQWHYAAADAQDGNWTPVVAMLAATTIESMALHKLNKMSNLPENLTSKPKMIWGKSAEQVAEEFRRDGYDVKIRQSTRGSGKATIVEIKGHSEVMQIQVHPGGGRHEGAYTKISTAAQGIIKVVDSKYKQEVNEKATIIRIGK